jgi:hypothetical protein
MAASLAAVRGRVKELAPRRRDAKREMLRVSGEGNVAIVMPNGTKTIFRRP